jgi:hypothetical protein
MSTVASAAGSHIPVAKAEADATLESLIASYRVIGTLEFERARQRDAFARMAELIERRSPEQIQAMEAERGLRAP